jgi:Ca2+-dependent lipid-binding protein
MFYKVKKGNEVIDVLEILSYVRYVSEINKILRCSIKENPNGIISSDCSTIWHVEGWKDFPESQNIETVTLTRISKEEFDTLQEKIETWDEKPKETDDQEEKTEETEATIMTRQELTNLVKAQQELLQNLTTQMEEMKKG